MKTIALSARVDELNELADHVPVSVLACRLLVVVETYLEANKAPAGTETMAGAFRTLDVPADTRRSSAKGPGTKHYQRLAEERYDEIKALEAELDVWRNPGVPLPSSRNHEPPVGDERFYVAPDIETRALLSEAAAEIAEAKLAHSEAVPAEGQVELEKPPADTLDSTRGRNGEPEKPCRSCGETKPLSEFGKDIRTADGHAHICADCKRAKAKKANRKSQEKQREWAKRKDQKPGPEPKNVTHLPRPEERLCAAGTRCVKADPDDLVPTPAILDAANDHPSGLCRGCQKKAGIV